jgi:hypothetical protein
MNQFYAPVLLFLQTVSLNLVNFVLVDKSVRLLPHGLTTNITTSILFSLTGSPMFSIVHEFLAPLIIASKKAISLSLNIS